MGGAGAAQRTDKAAAARLAVAVAPRPRMAPRTNQRQLQVRRQCPRRLLLLPDPARQLARQRQARHASKPAPHPRPSPPRDPPLVSAQPKRAHIPRLAAVAAPRPPPCNPPRRPRRALVAVAAAVAVPALAGRAMVLALAMAVRLAAAVALALALALAAFLGPGSSVTRWAAGRAETRGRPRRPAKRIGRSERGWRHCCNRFGQTPTGRQQEWTRPRRTPAVLRLIQSGRPPAQSSRSRREAGESMLRHHRPPTARIPPRARPRRRQQPRHLRKHPTRETRSTTAPLGSQPRRRTRSSSSSAHRVVNQMRRAVLRRAEWLPAVPPRQPR